jgi:hypothetical protein
LSQSTILAQGTINASGDTITMELIRPEDMPAINRTTNRAIIRIVWPLAPTVADSRRFPDTAATIARLFAEAATTLASIKANRRL